MNTQPSVVAALVAYCLLAVGFVLFVVLEVRRWRTLGAFLAPVQVIVRVTNLVLVGLLIVLMGILYFDLLPSTSLRLRVILICATPIVVLVVLALAIWDFREIQRARLRREIEWASHVARSIVQADDEPTSDSAEPPHASP